MRGSISEHSRCSPGHKSSELMFFSNPVPFSDFRSCVVLNKVGVSRARNQSEPLPLDVGRKNRKRERRVCRSGSCEDF